MDETDLFERATAILKTAWENPDWFIYGLTVLSASGFAAWRWLLPRLKSSTPPAPIDPSFPFEVIKPRSEGVLKRLMGSEQADGDPLADFNIPYQQRRPELSIQQQLEGLLEVHRWLLILGRTGLGKTREAGELATRLNSEGWTVLKLKNHEQLTVPTQFPAEVVGHQPKLIFFLDNLNQAMNLGAEASRDAQGNLPSALKQPLQERLQETLEFFERSCGNDRIRVVATARDETIAEKPGQPSEWDKLAIEKYPQFWSQFCQHPLPVPAETAIEAVLAQTTERASLSAKVEDFAPIAQRNDGTFRNVVENLERAKSRSLVVSTATYKETLRGTWQSRYQAATSRDKTAGCIYDAVDLLRQCNVELQDITVLPTAALLAQKTRLWQFWPRYKIRQGLQRLKDTERILQPRDGQIEAKGYTVAVNENLASLGKLLIDLSRRYPNQLENALTGFVVAAVGLERYKTALLANSRLTKLQPQSDVVWYNQAWLKNSIGQKEAAIACCDAALAIKPDYHEALYNKGVALSALGRKQEAIASYDAALAIKPDLHEALNNKGTALSALGRKEEAIASYDAALAIKPDYHTALNNKGTALSDLGRQEEAIASYDAALAIKPDYHEALYNKGNALSASGRKEEAIASYDAALAIKPDYHEALYNKGVALSDLGRKQEAIASYDAALAIKPDLHEALNNKGTALSASGRKEEAIASYDAALAIKPDLHDALNNKGTALSALGRQEEAIASYDAALAIKPDKHDALNNKGTALSALGRKEEAIASYDAALAIKPDLHEALNNKGNALDDLGRKEEAIASYDAALAIKPDYHDALNNKGLALSALGRYEEAIECCDQILSANSDYFSAWGIRGMALASLGRFEEALSSYDKALSIQPDSSYAIYKKACCYGLQGNADNALPALQAAIALNPKYRDMAKTDTDFDPIRPNARFQALLEGA
ncbi:tetratricopeptide repeat protein [Nodosilinea nodulosa]|uniref:tetratricopeptide repeat protein n=1 Tax=Nodosilinea nodulosa TaxID=416001 RepID=UPI00030C9ADB|nr:tetratricopeptide repeat protein [Nodosilinea nodulosa]